ncbi:hypothetical protein DM02DRAFT_619292 [Periconia macrospinosa]|uniref:Uncharacterized protein n=1 Tax=Periconia macrospinosa TaxID=97972 RepID=A0A2V1D5W4_9PLEO|nr:hypothetical protein DM02DRAFT_619292 [Periconia macrospinosa]
MAATRLRRTFQYPSESDDEDAVEEGMDEQDQETLLATLSAKDTTSTRLYTLLLLILPLVPAVLYVPRLFSLSPPIIIETIASIASLLSSAYALYFLPLPPVRISVLDSSDLGKNTKNNKGKSIARTSVGGKASDAAAAKGRRQAVPYISEEVAVVLEKYIVPVNVVLCVFLALIEVGHGRSWSEGMMIGGGYVPGFVLTVVMFARRELRVVDLGELERLRYSTQKGLAAR